MKALPHSYVDDLGASLACGSACGLGSSLLGVKWVFMLLAEFVSLFDVDCRQWEGPRCRVSLIRLDAFLGLNLV